VATTGEIDECASCNIEGAVTAAAIRNVERASRYVYRTGIIQEATVVDVKLLDSWGCRAYDLETAARSLAVYYRRGSIDGCSPTCGAARIAAGDRYTNAHDRHGASAAGVVA
jgi:hypothetical protein